MFQNGHLVLTLFEHLSVKQWEAGASSVFNAIGGHGFGQS